MIGITAGVIAVSLWLAYRCGWRDGRRDTAREVVACVDWLRSRDGAK